MRRTVPPSAEIERKIDDLLAGGVAAGEPEGPLSELAQLGAKLIIQRAVAALQALLAPDAALPERRGRDSNPRAGLRRPTVFKISTRWSW